MNKYIIVILLNILFNYGNAQKNELYKFQDESLINEPKQNRSNNKNTADPRQFIKVYEQKPEDRYSYLMWEQGYLSTGYIIDSKSKLYIDFNIDSIISNKAFNGSLSLKAKIGNREIEVPPYYTLGQSQSVIGNAGYYSINDFVNSLIGLLTYVDSYEPKGITQNNEVIRTDIDDFIETYLAKDKEHEYKIKTAIYIKNSIENIDIKFDLVKDYLLKPSSDTVRYDRNKDLARFIGDIGLSSQITSETTAIELKRMLDEYIDRENKSYQSGIGKIDESSKAAFGRDMIPYLDNIVKNEAASINGYLKYFNSKNTTPAEALSRALARDPVLITTITSNLTDAITEMTNARKKLDAGVDVNTLRSFNNSYKQFIYEIGRLQKINSDVIVGKLAKLNNTDKQMEDGNIIRVSKKVSNGYNYYYDKENLYSNEQNFKTDSRYSFYVYTNTDSSFALINTQPTSFTALGDLLSKDNKLISGLKDEIITETRKYVYNRLIPATIDLNNQGAKEGDEITIILVWIDPIDVLSADATSGKIEIPLCTFKVKETGWKVRVTESFFLIHNLNPDENNPNLSSSIFKGAAGVSLMIGYNSVNYGFRKNKIGLSDVVYKGRRKYDLKGHDKGHGYKRYGFNRFIRSLEPSFGVNICYLDFDNTKEFEVGLGLVLGLFRNSLQFTAGYNLNLKPSNQNFYLGVGFSFINIAEKIKSAVN